MATNKNTVQGIETLVSKELSKKTSLHIVCNTKEKKAVVLSKEQYKRDKTYQDYINDGSFQMLINVP